MNVIDMYRVGVKANKATQSSNHGDAIYRELADANGIPPDMVFKARLFAKLCTQDDAKALNKLDLTKSHIAALTSLGGRKAIMKFGRKAGKEDLSVRHLRSLIQAEKGLRNYGGRKPAEKDLPGAWSAVREAAQALENHIAYLQKTFGGEVKRNMKHRLNSAQKSARDLRDSIT